MLDLATIFKNKISSKKKLTTDIVNIQNFRELCKNLTMNFTT